MVQYQQKLDQVFSALGDATRRAMLARLMDGEASVSELSKPHNISLAGTAKHIRVLTDAGLVTHSKTGRVRTCRLSPAGMRVAADWIAQYEAYWRSRLEALDAVLQDLEDKE